MNARRLLLVFAPVPLLSACYVVPVQPYDVSGDPPASIAAVPATPGFVSGAPSTTLAARLYPANGAAAHRGMLNGTVTMSTAGKGRFVLELDGELLRGEATRVRGDERRGIANAYGNRGSYMSCDYRMTSALRGTGTCQLSDGARYAVHVGG